MSIFLASLFVQKSFAQDSAKSQLSIVLNDYYGVKDALVNSDAVVAASKASDLLKAINAVDMSQLTEPGHKAFMALKEKLSFDSRHISESKDISHQREHFTNLSDNMIALAKKAKLSAQPVYQAYCPMKKSYWLTNETAIKNPYYGKAMLTCGEIAKTLN
ncbi:MAG: DUF3347 domain-containing protein [Bacteroidetes bacterium]|nr:DUF3347 domain-containing protein [Bacteroidota bacterium]MBS1973525.1 DUF3347 domain-containing protein [Bacteroidota bacterium]